MKKEGGGRVKWKYKGGEVVQNILCISKAQVSHAFSQIWNYKKYESKRGEGLLESRK
jgi:hypothetical protein